MGRGRPVNSWTLRSPNDQLKLDNELRMKRAIAVPLKWEQHVSIVHGYKVVWRRWRDNLGRIYHYEVMDHTWRGLK